MACGKYGMNSPERAIWEKRSKMAAAILEGKSVEDVAKDFELTVDEFMAEIEAINTENPTAYQQIMNALKDKK